MAVDRLREVYGCSEGEALGEMIHELANEHVQAEKALDKRGAHRIFARDGWCCTGPDCEARAPLHAHHVVYRSRCGGDEDENKTTKCLACHELEHEKLVVTSGTAPDDLLVEVAGGREAYRDGLLAGP